MASSKRSIAIVVFLCLSASLSACKFNGIKGSGNVTTENRTVTESFKSIKAEKGLDVVLEQATESSITVIADDNLQKHIMTTVRNGVLIITSDINNFINVESKKIIVKMPVVEEIQVSSGASLNAKNTIKCKNIMVKSSSGATIDVNIEADMASCESSSGSSLKISGKAISLETASSSGSEIDAEKLLSNDITASASSGSSIGVHPLVSLTADASSGAAINYFNIPKNLNKKSSSGGSVNKE